ncbi:hypothetical protein VSS74_07740 [Conexibacter stalactiti]|uniref:PEP-CTERM sorting domain-containing protein n=1 Tax=Conexibacter stalactiti TaxID=1940611 RepID=A0ABU4HLT8_9ACTN|nr:hypothetical protein [Conexibacter stalactiti]MDW5594222.1 hypothetical protein [Conexibacter stalactiti]MEC5034864.1 hypothetical protein [Conexibacter stalactiti]
MSKSIDGLWRAPLRVLLFAAALVGLVAAFAASAAHATEVLLGNTLLITPGSAGATPTGSWFRLGVAPNYYSNASSTNTLDRTYTLLSPGTDGLSLLANQEPPTPTFDGSGNALADAIIAPTGFDGVDFSVATPSIDPITRVANGAPSIVVNLLARPATIVANLRAWTAYWNNQAFNQGAAVINATSFTLTRTGGTIVLDWVAPITSGPFAGYNGYWHIEGTVSNL